MLGLDQPRARAAEPAAGAAARRRPHRDGDPRARPRPLVLAARVHPLQRGRARRCSCSCSTSACATTSSPAGASRAPLAYDGAVASERSVSVGGVQIGGGAPVVVQSMTLTKTHDVPATTAQIAALASAGCEIVRVAVPKLEDAEALPRIVRFSPIPVIADIHFNASLALKAIDAGVPPCGSTPATSAATTRSSQVVKAAKKAGIPMRIGANSGSLPKHLEDARAGGSGRGARRGRARGGAAARAARLPRLQDLRQVEPRADDDPRLPDALRARAVPAPPRRDRGGAAGDRRDQERGRHGRAARRRDRRHDPRQPHRRPGRGGQGRVGDPEGARPARARAGADRLPELRPRQRRRPAARRGGRGAAARRTRSTSRSPCSAAR